MKKAKKVLADTEPYFFGVQRALDRMLRHLPDTEKENRYLDQRPEIAPGDRKIGLIVVTADKGLNGAYNHNIIKMAEERLKLPGHRKLYVLGVVGRQYFGKLKDVDMDITTNAITAFIGPSGCGKSTFLKTLNRMNDLVDGVKIDGEVTLDGENIYDEKVDTTLLRKKVGMVFQQPNPFPMSIYDNIAYGPRIHGIKSKARLDEIVEESLNGAAIFDEVKARLKKSALGLSGGQQQRLCIARALAVQPEVLLMDEPTSALDPISTLKIEDLMEDLKKKYTVVVVTHNMQQAARVSDETAFFLVGEVVEKDITSNIFARPKDKRTEDYITGRFG